MLSSSILSLLLFASRTLAILPDGRLHGNMPPPPMAKSPSLALNARTTHAATGAPLPPLNTTYIFDQLIDHNNPSLGTFSQRYWTTWEFYEPGVL